MARYLLDTSAIVDLSKQYEPAYSLIPRLYERGDELGVCAINVAEFYAGLQGRELPDWDEFFAALTYWPISRVAAVQAGRWRYEHARRGVQLTTTDTLTAAVAIEQRAIIITGNVKDFPMPDLQLLPLARTP